jgi:hypothetical protein
MGTQSWNSGDWARFAAGSAAAYVYNTKKNAEAEARAAAGQAQTSAVEAQKQTNTAEDERLRRLRLLQGGTSNTLEDATGRKTLLGQ